MTRRLAATQPPEAKAKTISECGLPIGGASGRVLIERGRVVPGQIRACRQGLRCPVCSVAQWKTLGEKVDWFCGHHETEGGWFAHSALTIPHTSADSLQTVLGRLAASWKDLRNHAGYRAERDRLNASAITTLQIKWSPQNGWHPHYHVLWLLEGRHPIEPFAEAVAAAWAAQTGRRGRPATEAHTELIRNRQGFWEYLSHEDDRHPANDCLHPDHMGCDRCNPRPPGSFRGQPVEPTPGPIRQPVRPVRQPRPPRTRPVRQPRPFQPRPIRGFEVFSELGWAALDGSRKAQALLAQYIRGTAGHGRVRKFAHLSRRYGPPPEHEPRHQPGGERMWISGDIWSTVELFNRGTGSPFDAIEDPEQTAAVLSTVTDRRIIVTTAADDGAPSLVFA